MFLDLVHNQKRLDRIISSVLCVLCTVFCFNVLEGTWQLAQFHLHWSMQNETGSEHTINGMAYPAEVPQVFLNVKLSLSDATFTICTFNSRADPD